MEKDYKLLEAETLPMREHDDDAPQKRSDRSKHTIVAVLLFFAATFWFTTIAPGFTIGHHGCSRKLSVEQRAARILKKHPLIGQ